MDKATIIERYKNDDDRLLISKLLDRIQLAEKQNKIQTTDFLSPIELQLLKDVLNSLQFNNYEIYGAVENAQRNIIIIYPDKLEKLFNEKLFDYNTVCSCIKITNNPEYYEHKVYLGGLIKLGIKREKIGDIIITENETDIIVSKEISKFILNNLKDLTRFSKSQIEIINLSEVIQKEQEFKGLKIIVSSVRLDNIVAELARTSRSKALELLKQERVFVNYKNETKATKAIQNTDLITIRGKGKFIIDEILGNTRSGKYILIAKKYV